MSKHCLPRPQHARLALVATVAVLALAGCGSSSGTSSGSPLEPAGTGDHDPGVVHVHGLGVDPGDGTLYAATHTGLFRLPEQGRAIRVANRYQDTMGFTVIGPRTFLGSGHPDLRERDSPSRLGLIRSADAGESWRSVSLSGSADFHALHAAHDKVYGYDVSSGRFMVSADEGRGWDTRSTLQMFDFATSPDDAEVVIATTPQGVVRSRDGGRTWVHTGSTAPVLLSWQTSAELWGVGRDGRVQVSPDGGGTWQARGLLGGAPEAISATSRGLVAAASGRGVLASTDGGTSWTVRYQQTS